MKNEIELFSFEGNQVRTLLIDGQPHFIGKDVAKVLGYKKPANAIRSHVDSEDKGVTELMTPGGTQPYQVINESGLYSLILSSKLPKAKKFKRWVTSEVLPAIRQTGSYQSESKQPSNVIQLLQDPDNLLRLVTNYKKVSDENKKIKPKADYFDKAMKNPALITTTEIAMSYGISATKLNRFLNEQHVIYRKGKTWVLYQEYKNKGYADYDTYNDFDRKIASNILKWTQCGKHMIDKLVTKTNFAKNLSMQLDISNQLPENLEG